MATLTLRPNDTGSETSISYQYPNSTYHWDKVDDVTPDEDSTCVYNVLVTSYQRDLYNLPVSGGSGAIEFIRVYFRCYDPEKVSYAKASIKSGSTVTDGTEQSITDTWTTYSERWDINPDTSIAWTWVDIDALQIGVSLKKAESGAAFCTQVYVEIVTMEGHLMRDTHSGSYYYRGAGPTRS